MATLVLSAAGAAAGSALGGSVLGLSTGVIGRAAAGTLGQVIDQQWMGSGSGVVEQGRVERFRLTGASEGAPIPQVYGRVRMPGQVIWASDFLEERRTQSTSGGKGSGTGSVTTTQYSYSVSLAIALCEGVITDVGRIWADGHEISRREVRMRVYKGTDVQMPDVKIAAVEGNDSAPAYRGTAYVVIEDLHLAPFGNRVPQFNFEVIRQETPAMTDAAGPMPQAVRGVALIPGTGEYSLATTPVHYLEGPGRKSRANTFTTGDRTDFLSSMNAMDAELPNCGAVSLIVCWFAGDLRCDRARLKPKVEHRRAEGDPQAWSVAGLSRLDAETVPELDGRPVYGGTPSDASVIESIRELKRRGKKVMFYPFILMDQLPGNGLEDPWTGAADQPALPWRGRITTSRAPLRPGSVDGTQAAEVEVAAFFGSAAAGDFTVGDDEVRYGGAEEWTLRRFILHYAALCAAAGGVDSFCIGTEMRSLTQIRGSANSFPAVAAFRDLAGDVRSLVGAGTRIGYAADWSEYFGYTPQDGSGDHFFHLDPLWADPEIDFIGIDNYMPLSDWRDGDDHLDAQGWGSIYDLDYLQANIEGGEGFDWYYPDEAAAETQTRVPITDGAYGEPWIFRYKDLRSWWTNQHHDRIDGVRQAAATPWVPESKPVWFTELGCAAINKGTNQPNKFLDPKSSESVVPRASTGARDDLIQMQYLRATMEYWSREANNPRSSRYGGRMLDLDRAFVWAWDARPYPWFPGLRSVWSDGPNYLRGHWLNGRTGSQLLATVVREICAEAGLTEIDVSRLYGLVRGYMRGGVGSARAALEPLMLAYGFDAFERGGRLVFRNRGLAAVADLEAGEMALASGEDTAIRHARGSAADAFGRVRVTHLEADGDFDVVTTEAALPGRETDSSAEKDVKLVLTAGEARALAERMLAETRVARDTATFAVPPSSHPLGAGDVVEIAERGFVARYRIDRVEDAGLRSIEATRVEGSAALPAKTVEEVPWVQAEAPAIPPTPVFLDLPELAQEDRAVAPYVAVAGNPWPGSVAIYDSGQDASYRLNSVVETPATIGVTRAPLLRAAPGRIDRGPALRVEMSDGTLQSVGLREMLSGANAMAIGDGSTGLWEVFQFAEAAMVGGETYDLSIRLRGQLGTDAMMPEVWPEGSFVVLLDAGVRQIDFQSSWRGLERHFRIGPARLDFTDDAYVRQTATFDGIGLRPFAPVHLRAAARPGGGHDVSWIRRTRIDGDLWSLAEVPLGETEERYLVQVRQDGKTLREREVTAPSWSYSASAQASDGVTGECTVRVAQISDRFGPGLFREVWIDV